MKASAQSIKLKSMCGRIGQMGLGKDTILFDV